MKFSRRYILGISAAVVGTAVLMNVSSAPVEQASPYRVLRRPPPPPGPIEVVEFFWYSCPHCHEFEPVLQDWLARHRDQVVFRRVPVGVKAQQVPQQRMFYAMEELGLGERANHALFEQIHTTQQRLDTEETLAGFASGLGVDRARFRAAWDSAAVQRKVAAATQLHTEMNVTQVPTVVIGGRYATSPAMLGATMPLWDQTAAMRHAATVKTMDELLARARQDSTTR